MSGLSQEYLMAVRPSEANNPAHKLLEQSAGKRLNRWYAKVPDVVWSPLVTAGLILIIGLLGLTYDQPWIFPSLGATAFLQTQAPGQPASRIYNVFTAHMVGLGAGFVSVALFAAYADPAVMSSGHLTFARVAASVMAIALTMAISLSLKAPHPPANATTLIISLGGLPFNFNTILTLVVGVTVLAGLGEIARRLRAG